MARRLVLGLLIATVATLAVNAVPVAQSRDIYLQSTRWLDPVTGELRGPVAIQTSGRRIAKILAPGDVDRRRGDVIDLGDATILPGLIDAHVHLTIGATPEENARAVLTAGFTTVVDLGATSDAVLRLRDRINAGSIEGPRILAAGLWAGTKGGVCEFGGIGIASGAGGFRARVRENIDAGADLTKVCVSSWLADAFARPEVDEIDDASLTAAVDESHRRSRRAIAHAISLGSVKAALRAGVDGLAHAAFVDAPTAALMHDRGVFLIPTLASLVAERTGPAAVALRQAVVTAHKAGVRLVFGTDGGVLPHGENAKEFPAMAAAGLAPIEVIRAATINAARAFSLDKQIGTLAAGLSADIIAVDGDPLRDLRALSRVVFVMRDGRIFRFTFK